MYIVKLDKWQEEILSHDGDFLLNSGRQCGKTTVMAIKMARYAIEHENSQIICCSLTIEQAKLILVMTLDWLEKNDRAMIGKGVNKPTQNRIRLRNGSQIITRPVGLTGDAIRGFTGNILVLDEVSRFSGLVMEAAKPTLLTTGGQIWACSTPFGKKGWFWETYKSAKAGEGRFRLFEVNSWDCMHNREISESWTEHKREMAVKHLEQEKKDMTRKQFGQEYMGLFLEDLQALFDPALIKKCMTASRGMHRPEGRNYCGVDIARMGDDQTVITSFCRMDSGILRQFDMEITKKTLLTGTIALIKDSHHKYFYDKILIDSAGVGGGVFDILLQDPDTRIHVVSIDNAKRSIDYEEGRKRILKEDLYSNLLCLMEQGKIELLDEDDIYLSLSSMQYEYDDNGKIKIYGNYDHIAESIVRAAWPMQSKDIKMWVAFS